MIPISLGDLERVKAGAHRLVLVQYTRGLYDPGPGTGSVEETAIRTMSHRISYIEGDIAFEWMLRLISH